MLWSHYHQKLITKDFITFLIKMNDNTNIKHQLQNLYYEISELEML
jgi:hypothetical protein